MDNPLLTTEDVATYLKVNIVTVRRLIRAGKLPAYKIGSDYRFHWVDIQEFLETQRVCNQAPDPHTGMVKSLVDTSSEIRN